MRRSRSEPRIDAGERRFDDAREPRILRQAAPEHTRRAKSRERIGRFDAHTVGLSWRHFLTPEVGLEGLYAHQDRSGDAASDAWSLRVLHRW